MFAYATAFSDSGPRWACDRRSTSVPAYYTSQQLAQSLGIAEDAIAELQTRGLLQPTVNKYGRSFFSSRQAHCLPTPIRWARNDKVDLQEAFPGLEEPSLAPTCAPTHYHSR